MSITELKTWGIECDRCGRSKGTIIAAQYPGKPEGWEWHEVHDCGLTGYTRKDLLCDSCVRKSKGIREDY